MCRHCTALGKAVTALYAERPLPLPAAVGAPTQHFDYAFPVLECAPGPHMRDRASRRSAHASARTPAGGGGCCAHGTQFACAKRGPVAQHAHAARHRSTEEGPTRAPRGIAGRRPGAHTGPHPLAARRAPEVMDAAVVTYLADWIATVEQANGGAVCVAPISVEGDGYCLNHAVSRALFGAEARAARAGRPGAPQRRATPR
jgi:hypothetical protein